VGVCTFCGKSAGFFRTQHAECAASREAFRVQLMDFFVKALSSPIDPKRFYELVVAGCRAQHLDDEGMGYFAAVGVGKMIDAALEDHLLTDQEFARIVAMSDTFNIDMEVMETLTGAHTKLIKARVLQDLHAGKVTNRTQLVEGFTPNFESGETPVWSFFPATYFSQRAKTEYLGGSQGVSVRLAKGVYYRVGAQKGTAIRTDYLSQEAVGALTLASRNAYFVGQMKAVKIPLKRIVAVSLFEDGIVLSAGATTTKPHIFQIDDPPFAANVLAHLQ
jgi:hypothetical protein